MKKLILILLIVLPFTIYSQEKKDEFKDYKPCTECLDGWKKSNGDFSPSITTPQKDTGEIRNRARRVGTFFVSAVGVVAAAVMYKKLNDEANKIP